MSLNTLSYCRHFDELFDPVLKANNFIKTIDEEKDFSYIKEFRNSRIRLRFNYDTRDNFFYFYVILGLDTNFPNDADRVNIQPLLKLYKETEPDIDLEKLQPDSSQYYDSLKRNAEMLQKHFKVVLAKSASLNP